MPRPRETSQESDTTRQVSVPDGAKTPERHFNVRLVQHADFLALYANDISAQVQAQKVRREFVHTLTKTFADLATGLVVFDQRKKLALFNPALIDLTGLSPEFLSARPGLTGFFDRLRNQNVLPEPRNYATWRAQIDDMIESAEDGHYLEDWTLPSGLTYRVTGRPHPDGAIAFLFEDISDAVSVTRRFRSQLDLRQAVLDQLDQAIAVVGQNNVVMFCNEPCAQLLKIDPDTSFADLGVADFLAICRSRLPDSEIWAVVRSAIAVRSSCRAVSTAQDFTCCAKPLPGGSVMISISHEMSRSSAAAESA